MTFAKFLKQGAASLVLAGAALSAPAFAQDVNTDLTLGTITVTAQQREENLQDVPVSVTTLPEGLLAAMTEGGEDILALSGRVPGVYAESSNGRAAPRFYIRGLGNTDFDLAASQPVSIIMDDIVMENVALKSTPIFDVDQVEVSRGPQGTLFGRNTTAGIIKFTSARPTDEFEGYIDGTLGSLGTRNLEAAVSGPLIGDVLKARVSVLSQHRDDYIDNTEIPGGNNLGEFDELAGRVQVLFTPNDRFEALVNVHGRDLDGTAAIFRANVLDAGSNKLNANYDREAVSYNEGADNHQAYEGWGANARLVYDFGPVTLTSITGYETLTGSSEGDIDGGVAGVGPGFIPFDSYTRDSIDDLDQTSQELRLASNSDGRLFWQAGAYYFDGAFTVTTVGPSGFPFPTTLEHSNTSYAVYGQTSYDVTDKFTATAGVRYTNDEKDLIVAANTAQNRTVSDDHVSWELSGMYDITDAFSVYGRVADGFRGPSIQGRDIAFFADPSVAQSETILSVEAGWKSSLMADTMRLNGAVYAYEVSDMQLTAVGGADNLVRLINAESGKAHGFEIDAEWLPIRQLMLTGGLAYTKTELDQSDLAVGVCAQCTVLDDFNANNFALIDGNPFPNAPELSGNFTAQWTQSVSQDFNFVAYTDWTYQGETNIFLYESVEFLTDNQFEGGLSLGLEKKDGSLSLSAWVRNITDEDNIKGGIDFNNNTAFVNEPRIWGVSVRTSF